VLRLQLGRGVVDGHRGVAGNPPGVLKRADLSQSTTEVKSKAKVPLWAAMVSSAS